MILKQRDREKTIKKTVLSAIFMSLCFTVTSGYEAYMSEKLKMEKVKFAVSEVSAR